MFWACRGDLDAFVLATQGEFLTSTSVLGNMARASNGKVNSDAPRYHYACAHLIYVALFLLGIPVSLPPLAPPRPLKRRCP